MRPAVVIATVFLFDALIQLSFNQREMMALFGIVCGILLAAGRGSDKPGGAPDAPQRRRTGSRFVPVATAGLLIAGMAAHVVPALYAAAHKQAAEDALAAGDTRDAVRSFRLASQWAPRDPIPLLSLGLIEAGVRGPDSGARFVEKALALQPESAMLHASLARLRLKAGRSAEAEALVRRALELYPTNAEHHELMSEVLQARGRPAAALESARRAVQYGYRYPERYKERVRELETKIEGLRGGE